MAAITIKLQLDIVGLLYTQKFDLSLQGKAKYSVEDLMFAALEQNSVEGSVGVPKEGSTQFFQYRKNMPLLPGGTKTGLSELIASYRAGPNPKNPERPVESKSGKTYKAGDYRHEDVPFFFEEGVQIETADGIAVWQYYLQEVIAEEENIVKELSFTKRGDIIKDSTTGKKKFNFTAFSVPRYELQSERFYRLIWRSVNIYTAPKTNMVFPTAIAAPEEKKAFHSKMMKALTNKI